MTYSIMTIVEPFVQRGLFASPEQAVTKMAYDYVLHQVEHYQDIIEELQTKYRMTYKQFNAYLQSRSNTLLAQPHLALNQAIMAEEEDALDWKIAREMLQNWLGLQTETSNWALWIP